MRPIHVTGVQSIGFHGVLLMKLGIEPRVLTNGRYGAPRISYDRLIPMARSNNHIMNAFERTKIVLRFSVAYSFAILDYSLMGEHRGSYVAQVTFIY